MIQFIRNCSCFSTVCQLLYLLGVLTFSQCFRSDLTTEVVLHRTVNVHPDNKVCPQNVSEMFNFITYFEENKSLQQKIVLSLTRIDFAVRVPGPYVFLARP